MSDAYTTRSDAEDAARWRDLMRYIDAHPGEPSAEEIAEVVAWGRFRMSSIYELVAAASENIFRVATRSPAAAILYGRMYGDEAIMHVPEFVPQKAPRFAPGKLLKELFARDRRTIARLWFGGSTQNADAVLDSLPYSTIPGWRDVDTVMREMRRIAVAEKPTDVH